MNLRWTMGDEVTDGPEVDDRREVRDRGELDVEMLGQMDAR